MSGTEFLLDTNIVLGVLQGHEPALALLEDISPEQCGYSSITRMELLGFPGITAEETQQIAAFLGGLKAFPLDKAIEEQVIQLRQQRKIKLPDAVIAATALVNRLELITLDKKLQAAYRIGETVGK